MELAACVLLNCEMLENVLSLEHFYHFCKHQKMTSTERETQQTTMSSQSFKLSGMKAIQVGRTNSLWPYNSINACLTIYRTIH